MFIVMRDVLCVSTVNNGNDIHYGSTVMYQQSNIKYIVEQASNDSVLQA